MTVTAATHFTQWGRPLSEGRLEVLPLAHRVALYRLDLLLHVQLHEHLRRSGIASVSVQRRVGNGSESLKYRFSIAASESLQRVQLDGHLQSGDRGVIVR